MSTELRFPRMNDDEILPYIQAHPEVLELLRKKHPFEVAEIEELMAKIEELAAETARLEMECVLRRFALRGLPN